MGDPEPAAGADELQQFEVGQESPKITFTVRKAGNIHMQEAAFKNSHSMMNKARGLLLRQLLFGWWETENTDFIMEI